MKNRKKTTPKNADAAYIIEGVTARIVFFIVFAFTLLTVMLTTIAAGSNIHERDGPGSGSGKSGGRDSLGTGHNSGGGNVGR